MAKLTKREIDTLTTVIRNKIKEKKTEEAYKKLKESPQYSQYKKLVKEWEKSQTSFRKYRDLMNVARCASSRLETQINKLVQTIPFFKKTDTCMAPDLAGKQLHVILPPIDNYHYKSIPNDLILMNINADVNVQGLIDQLVEKYSKAAACGASPGPGCSHS